MDILLDTHTFLWFVSGDKRLSGNVIDAIENQKFTFWISVVSFWEIAIKLNLGKLEYEKGVQSLIEIASEISFEILPLELNDTIIVSKLDFIHRDSFDRIIVAQAINHNFMISTNDENIKKYEVPIFW